MLPLEFVDEDDLDEDDFEEIYKSENKSDYKKQKNKGSSNKFTEHNILEQAVALLQEQEQEICSEKYTKAEFAQEIKMTKSLPRPDKIRINNLKSDIDRLSWEVNDWKEQISRGIIPNTQATTFEHYFNTALYLQRWKLKTRKRKILREQQSSNSKRFNRNA